MSTLRFTLPRTTTIRTVQELAPQLRTLPVDGELVVDASDLAQCDAAALQLLLALRASRAGRTTVTAVPDDQAWRFRCVGIDPCC